jgi:hypothetical protein
VRAHKNLDTNPASSHVGAQIEGMRSRCACVPSLPSLRWSKRGSPTHPSVRRSTFNWCAAGKAKGERAGRFLSLGVSTTLTGETSRVLRASPSEIPFGLPACFRMTPAGIAFFVLRAVVLGLTDLANTGHTDGGAAEVEVVFCFFASLALAMGAFCAGGCLRLTMTPKPGDGRKEGQREEGGGEGERERRTRGSRVGGRERGREGESGHGDLCG